MNAISNEIIEKNEDFIAVISKLDKNASYQAYINSALPNEGASISDICATGFEQYQKNYKDLDFS